MEAEFSVFHSGLNNGLVPIVLPKKYNCSQYCMIHNFPFRQLVPCLISTNNTYTKSMSEPIISKIHQLSGYKIIDTDNIEKSRYDQTLVEYVYYNKSKGKDTFLRNFSPIYIDNRYISTNCVSFILLRDEETNTLYETSILNHKKFVFEILKACYKMNCVHNPDIIINAFIVFLEHFIIDNLYSDIDIEWCKDKLNIIRIYTGSKDDLIKYLLEIMK
jgi:hypothetical protein